MLDINTWSESQKLLFLARMAHELTVCGRSTYEVGGEGVTEPNILRAYNELLHRVTGALRDHMLKEGGMPLATVIQMINDFDSEYRRTEIGSALKRVLERMARS